MERKHSRKAGKRFHHLVSVRALKSLETSLVSPHPWLWRCDCGKEVHAPWHSPVQGHKKSCGCMAHARQVPRKVGRPSLEDARRRRAADRLAYRGEPIVDVALRHHMSPLEMLEYILQFGETPSERSHDS